MNQAFQFMRVNCLGWSDWLELSYETTALQNVYDEAVHKSESDFTTQHMRKRESFRLKSFAKVNKTFQCNIRERENWWSDSLEWIRLSNAIYARERTV